MTERSNIPRVLFSFSLRLSLGLLLAIPTIASQAFADEQATSLASKPELTASSAHGTHPVIIRPKEDLPNFHEVHPYLYRGGEPNSEGVEKLHQLGIKTVIDLRGHGHDTEEEKEHVEKLGMRYFNLPMDSRAPSKETVDTFLHEVEAAKHAGTRKPVFVHCQHGSDRTGCLVGVWRVSHEDWSYDKAYQEMRKYYFSPKFTNLSNTVKDYAKK